MITLFFVIVAAILCVVFLRAVFRGLAAAFPMTGCVITICVCLILLNAMYDVVPGDRVVAPVTYIILGSIFADMLFSLARAWEEMRNGMKKRKEEKIAETKVTWSYDGSPYKIIDLKKVEKTHK